MYTWDPKKDKKNFKDHGIHLSTAVYVFDDPLRIVRHDDDSSIGEERYQTMGLVGQVLFVAYTEEGDEDITIISARIADPKERRIYYGEDTALPYGWERAWP